MKNGAQLTILTALTLYLTACCCCPPGPSKSPAEREAARAEREEAAEVKEAAVAAEAEVAREAEAGAAAEAGLSVEDYRSKLEEAEREAAAAAVAAAAEAAATAEAEKWGPASQQAFCRVIEDSREKYESASGDLKKSKERKTRASQLTDAVPGRKAVDWIGSVKTLTTTGEGKAILVLKLPCGAAVGTTNNAFTDSLNPMRTLILQSSGLFDVISDFEAGSWGSDGTAVTFSGSFARDSEGKDGFEEGSLMELSSMTGPEFLMKFSAVSAR